MSYDVSLYADTGGPEPVEVYWRNHTSNTAKMWREAGCDLAEFDGRPASDLGAALQGAILDMQYRTIHYSHWNPEHGWGSVDTTLEFLRDVRAACLAHPKTIVRVGSVTRP